MVDCIRMAKQAVGEPMEEDKKEADKEADLGEGSSTTDLAPKQALAPWATIFAAPGFWVVGPSDQVAMSGPAISSRAQGKAPTIQPESLPPAETNKELVHWLQAEELAVEEAC